MRGSIGGSRTVSFPFELDLIFSKGKVLDFLSSENFSSPFESLRLEEWLDRRTRSSAVGNLAKGRGMESSVRALLEGMFS
jgi:hypothetical protein